VRTGCGSLPKNEASARLAWPLPRRMTLSSRQRGQLDVVANDAIQSRRADAVVLLGGRRLENLFGQTNVS
jgi:hypothetical protein